MKPVKKSVKKSVEHLTIKEIAQSMDAGKNFTACHNEVIKRGYGKYSLNELLELP